MASKLALRSKVAFDPESASTRKCATPVAFSQKMNTFFLADSRFLSGGGCFGNMRALFNIALPTSPPVCARRSLNFTSIPQRNGELPNIEGTNCGQSEDCELRSSFPE